MALLLTLASIGFLLFGWLQQSFGEKPPLALSLAPLVLLAGAWRRPRPHRSRWLIVGASLGYSLLVLVALGERYAHALSPATKSIMIAFLLLGLLLCLRSWFQATRPTRYGFRNYYD